VLAEQPAPDQGGPGSWEHQGDSVRRSWAAGALAAPVPPAATLPRTPRRARPWTGSRAPG